MYTILIRSSVRMVSRCLESKIIKVLRTCTIGPILSIVLLKFFAKIILYYIHSYLSYVFKHKSNRIYLYPDLTLGVGVVDFDNGGWGDRKSH